MADAPFTVLLLMEIQLWVLKRVSFYCLMRFCFLYFFYGVGGCKNAMSENLRFIAGLLLLLEWSTEL